MSLALKNLLMLLNLEKIEERLFQGQSEDLGLHQVFGGQIVGQALYVAKETVPERRLVHSLHSYFLHPGDSQKPITYDIEVLHGGNSFSAHHVAATQNSRPILYMTTSFQAPEDGFERQKTMPDAPDPDELKSETEIVHSVAHLLPPLLRERFINGCPLEARPVKFHNPLKDHVAPPTRRVQIRTSGELQDDLHVHQHLLGYASDLNLLPVALQPYGIGFLEEGIRITTIDHSMRLHRPFNINERLLYNVENTSASGARGFVRGEFYMQDSVLVVSTVQEGVMCSHN